MVEHRARPSLERRVELVLGTTRYSRRSSPDRTHVGRLAIARDSGIPRLTSMHHIYISGFDSSGNRFSSTSLSQLMRNGASTYQTSSATRRSVILLATRGNPVSSDEVTIIIRQRNEYSRAGYASPAAQQRSPWMQARSRASTAFQQPIASITEQGAQVEKQKITRALC